MITLQISVTKEDIDRGVRMSAPTCPVARAITRATGAFTLVDGQNVRLEESDGSRQFGVLPHDVADKVVAYDVGDGMHPFDFTIDLEFYGANRWSEEAQ